MKEEYAAYELQIWLESNNNHKGKWSVLERGYNNNGKTLLLERFERIQQTKRRYRVVKKVSTVIAGMN